MQRKIHSTAGSKSFTLAHCLPETARISRAPPNQHRQAGRTAKAKTNTSESWKYASSCNTRFETAAPVSFRKPDFRQRHFSRPKSPSQKAANLTIGLAKQKHRNIARIPLRQSLSPQTEPHAASQSHQQCTFAASTETQAIADKDGDQHSQPTMPTVQAWEMNPTLPNRP
jgi:hypothetical protein